jgi:(p)ppGpp synthase/HD superfamily hydrolase
VVAWLHDTLEDTKVTPAMLRSKGISQRVIDAVQAMTHAPKTKEEKKALRKDPVAWEKDYLDYIEKQVKPNDLARQVKISDLKHNMADKNAVV